MVFMSVKFAKSIKWSEKFISQSDILVIYFIGFLMTIYHEVDSGIFRMNSGNKKFDVLAS